MGRENITLLAQYFADIDGMEKEYRDFFTLAMANYGGLGEEPNFSVFEPKERSFLVVIWQNIKRQLDFAISQRDKAKRKRGPREGADDEQQEKYVSRNLTETKPKENTASKTQADHKQDASSPQADSKRKRVNFKSGLTDAGVTEDIASDFMDVRKGKKARNTQTALDAILSEIQTAKDNGTSADEFIKAAVVNSWQMPKYEWYKNRQDSTLTTQSDQRHADRRRTETKATSWQDYSETF